MAEIDSQLFRSTMGQFCTGVVVATACLDGEPVGHLDEITRARLDQALRYALDIVY